ncbi:anti-CBASS protein Acb1 family protein, partial [Enterococcus faecalis]
MGNIANEAKLLKLDGKAYRSDFMLGNGKGHARDNLSRQRPGMSKRLSHSQLESLYSSNSMAKNIVDIPAEDLTRNGWSLKMQDDKVKALYESKLRQLKAKERLQQLFTYERLYGDGFVSIGTIEKREYSLSEPLDFENIKSVPYINAFSGKKISNRIIDEDVFSPNYGQIESFEVNNRSNNSRIQLLNNTTYSTA